MSIQSEIDRISDAISNTYSVLEEYGATIPEIRDSNNLPQTASTIPAPISIDKTLTQAGKAADAKAVGDKFLRFAIKNTANGKGVIRLKDSVEEKILDFKMQGRTEQETLEGINLFNLEKALKIENWYPRETAQPSFQFGIKVDKGYRYSLSVEENNMDTSNVDKIYISTTDNRTEVPYSDMLKPRNKLASPEITSSGWIYIIIFTSKEFNSQFLEEIFLEKLKNPQIQKGSVALPYEPYVGGKPQPNPENLKEIVSAGKKDEDIGKYTVNVKLTGKNLWNPVSEDYVQGLCRGWYIDTEAEYITLSIRNKDKSVDVSGLYLGLSGNGEGTNLGIGWVSLNVIGNSVNNLTLKHKYVTIYPPSDSSLQKLLDRFYIQVEEGRAATEYEPYKEQIVTLTSDRPITKFDKLEKRDGVWGWVYKTGMLNLADAKNWSINDDGYTDNLTHRVYTEIQDAVRNSKAFCNKLYPFAAGDITNIKVADYECFNISNGRYLQMKLLKERGTTVDELKAFFAESDIYVMYESVEEEFVPLTQEEQDMLNNLHTYYPATVISNGEECEMEVTYAADTTTYVNNKIAEIAAAALKGV